MLLAHHPSRIGDLRECRRRTRAAERRSEGAAVGDATSFAAVGLHAGALAVGAELAAARRPGDLARRAELPAVVALAIQAILAVRAPPARGAFGRGPLRAAHAELAPELPGALVFRVARLLRELRGPAVLVAARSMDRSRRRSAVVASPSASSEAAAGDGVAARCVGAGGAGGAVSSASSTREPVEALVSFAQGGLRSDARRDVGATRLPGRTRRLVAAER